MSSEMLASQINLDGMSVPRVYEPHSVAEAADLLERAGRGGERVLLTAGCTRLVFGNVGGPFDAALSTRKLNNVIHYEPDDMTLAVEPGCTIAQLKTLLGQHNQALALDAAHEEQATIGGAVATGLSGPRRLGSGSLKDWLIGIEVAGPDGAIAKAGGMVVKNVTGFDMMHTHYGALGALGLITRINLKVFPQAASSRSIEMRFDSAASAHAAGVSLLNSQLQPSSIVMSNDEGWTLYVRCDAPSSAIERLTQRIIESANDATSPASVDTSADGDRALASFRRAVDLIANEAVARLPVSASRQSTALATLDRVPDLHVCADLGSGLIYIASPYSDYWLKTIQEASPDATYLSLPAGAKGGMDVFGPVSAPAADVVRRLKHSFDPNGVLNRGRFVLGL